MAASAQGKQLFKLDHDAERLQGLGRQLKDQADGKMLRRQLSSELRKSLEPVVNEVISALMSMGTSGLTHDGPGLREATAKQIKAGTRLSGRSTGAFIKAKRTPDLRGFTFGGRRLNRRGGWRHPVYGNREAWVFQQGVPGFFDDTIAGHKDEYIDVIRQVMDDTAAKIVK